MLQVPRRSGVIRRALPRMPRNIRQQPNNPRPRTSGRRQHPVPQAMALNY